MKTNDVILKSLSAIISGCIFLLSLSLYFGGHFLPGGGFVGGLLCTMALALAMFTYGIDRVNKLLPINYVYVTAIGLLFSIGTAFSGVVVGKNFFKHHFTHIHVPIMGEMELHTAAIMEFYMIILCGILVGFGVYLMLSKSMMRIIIGVGLFGHAANLIILIAGGLYDGDIPIISELGKNYIDPIPAALILTAIVIGFAVTCLLISIYIANYKLKGSDNVIDLEDVKNMKEERNNA